MVKSRNVSVYSIPNNWTKLTTCCAQSVWSTLQDWFSLQKMWTTHSLLAVLSIVQKRQVAQKTTNLANLILDQKLTFITFFHIHREEENPQKNWGLSEDFYEREVRGNSAWSTLNFCRMENTRCFLSENISLTDMNSNFADKERSNCNGSSRKIFSGKFIKCFTTEAPPADFGVYLLDYAWFHELHIRMDWVQQKMLEHIPILMKKIF